MSEPKYVRVERNGEALIVSPLFTFARFTDDDIADEWSQVQSQIDGADVKHVLVDLGQIPYFGSTVLEWMVQMWKRVKAKDGKLATCNASPIGREVLTAARFDILWGICGSREEALAWLAAGGE
ncbi:MAG TPA: STAS domain-containing protein [Pirellulaceae bacterium]|nr:STAS domain-containing protein [Pirellulaceae bacterium]